jgi:hypothetical protein
VRSSLWFGVGVLPSLALASWFNYLKFRSLNPFSYGQPGGNTDLSAYGPLFAALCVGFGALILWRRVDWRMDRRLASASLVIIGCALLLIPATHAWLLRFWNGFLVLIVDVRNVEDHRIGIRPGPGHTMLFWNLFKKSLGQSMPWIGISAMLLTSGVQKDDRRLIATLLIFIATMTMPFILLSWHGGGGSNMRYFLPVLPPLCILCAKVIVDLWQSVTNAAVFATAGLWIAIGICTAWATFHPSLYAGVQQILSTYVLLATALAAIAAGAAWRFQREGRRVAIVLLGSGIIISMTSALSDYRFTTMRRSESHSIGAALASLPAKSLVITFPEWVAARIPGNGSILATRDAETMRADPQLIFDALDAGYRVFMNSFEFEATRDVPPGVEAVPSIYEYPGGRMIELQRRADTT